MRNKLHQIASFLGRSSLTICEIVKKNPKQFSVSSAASCHGNLASNFWLGPYRDTALYYIIFVIVIVHDSEPNFLQICRHSMFFRSWMPGGPASQVAPRLRLHQTGGRLLAVAAPLEVPKGLRIQLLNSHLAAWFLMTYWLEHYRGHQVPIFLRVLTSMFLAHGKALLISQGILKHTGVSYTTAATTKNSHHWITDMHQCMQVKQLGKTSAPKKGDCERLRCKISLQKARSRTSSRSVCYVTSCMML